MDAAAAIPAPLILVPYCTHDENESGHAVPSAHVYIHTPHGLLAMETGLVEQSRQTGHTRGPL